MFVAASYVPEECQARRRNIGASDPSSHDGLSISCLRSARTSSYFVDDEEECDVVDDEDDDDDPGITRPVEGGELGDHFVLA